MKLLRNCGIVPEMSFKERSKIRKYFNLHVSHDMLPLNLLERRIRTINCGRSSAIHAGIFLENLLFPKSINFK